MTTKNISIASIFFTCILLMAPVTTYGYFTTQQTSQRITDSTALYIIDFHFGFQDEDVYIPIMTQRTTENDPANKTVGYTFTTSETGNTEAGTTQALVLSDAEIVDNMYKIPAGHRGYFKLVVALTLDKSDAKAKYGLQVTNLPFTKVEGDKTQEYGLGVPGLFAYHTKEVGLNR